MISQFAYEARRGEMLPWLMRFDATGGDKGELAGQLTVSAIRYGAARWASIGYWIDQRLAGRGITPAAVALATDYCFRTMQLHRVEIDIRPENTASLRVVEKLGFRHEGLRPRFLHIDGDWRDHECFALNAEEVPEGMWQRLGPGVPRLD
jgi:[ribosomal protein S5]-alanine N-acetyltransferase